MNELLTMETVVSQSVTPTGANGPVDFNSSGDKFIFTPAQPIDVYRWGFIATALLDPDAGGFVLELDHRPTAGSDTGRVNISTITRTDTQTVAAGKVIHREVIGEVAETTTPGLGETTVKINVEPTGPFQVNPGQELVVEVTNTLGAAGTGYVWIEYTLLPFTGTRIANATKVTV